MKLLSIILSSLLIINSLLFTQTNYDTNETHFWKQGYTAITPFDGYFVSKRVMIDMLNKYELADEITNYIAQVENRDRLIGIMTLQLTNYEERTRLYKEIVDVQQETLNLVDYDNAEILKEDKKKNVRTFFIILGSFCAGALAMFGAYQISTVNR